MPKRAMSPCRKSGCSALVERPGYCPAHQPACPDRAGFAALDARKTPEQRKLYGSARWTAVSKAVRVKEPLCRRCKVAGRIVPAQMVHHNPPVEVLLARGDSPYDERFLEPLCNMCHLKELREKKNINK